MNKSIVNIVATVPINSEKRYILRFTYRRAENGWMVLFGGMLRVDTSHPPANSVRSDFWEHLTLSERMAMTGGYTNLAHNQRELKFSVLSVPPW